MAPAGRCKRPSALAMVRICFHALIITGGAEKVNQKYYFLLAFGCCHCDPPHNGQRH
jgi:hypothetical protein